MKRPIKMVPPGNMAGVYRAQRVSSSTCQRPSSSQEGAVIGNQDTEIDFSDFPRALNGVEKAILYNALDNDTLHEGCSYY
jgi:hypothetical protein